MNQETIYLYTELDEETGEPIDYMGNYPEQKIDAFRRSLEDHKMPFVEAMHPDQSVTFIY